MEISIADAAYIAGLFDAHGSVQYKQAWEKKKKNKGKGYCKTYAWRINMEIAMTDESVIQWVHEILNVGSVIKRKPQRSGYKPQWRWRCTFRDALYVAKLIWSEAKVKLHKIEQIIDHYEPRAQELGDNIVDLETEREIRKI